MTADRRGKMGTRTASETCRSISGVGPALVPWPFSKSDGSSTWRPMCLGAYYVRHYKSIGSDSPHPKEFYKPKKIQAFYICKCIQFGCVHSTSAFHFCKYSPKQASWQRCSEKQLVSGKNTTQFSSKPILNLHALVHLLISPTGIDPGQQGAVQCPCPWGQLAPSLCMASCSGWHPSTGHPAGTGPTQRHWGTTQRGVSQNKAFKKVWKIHGAGHQISLNGAKCNIFGSKSCDFFFRSCISMELFT